MPQTTQYTSIFEGAQIDEGASVCDVAEIEGDPRLALLATMVCPVWLYRGRTARATVADCYDNFVWVCLRLVEPKGAVYDGNCVRSCADRRNVWANHSCVATFHRPKAELLSADLFKLENEDDQKKFAIDNEELQKVVEAEAHHLTIRYTTGSGRIPGLPVLPPEWQAMTASFQPFTTTIAGGARVLVMCQARPEEACEMTSGRCKDVSRAVVMFQHNPLFSFIFDETGSLLLANATASAYYKGYFKGCDDSKSLTFRTLFEVALYDSEEDRAFAAADAWENVMVHRRNYRTQQRRRSRKNRQKVKWSEVEMWPVTDPVTQRPAVMVCQFSITEQKAKMLALDENNNQLRQKNEKLTERLERAEGQKNGIETPLGKTVSLLDRIMNGEVPSEEEIMTVRDHLMNANLWQPTHLKEHLLSDQAYDRDVGLNLLQMLGESEGASPVSDQEQTTGINNHLHLRDTGHTMRLVNGITVDSSMPSIVPHSIKPEVEQVLAQAERWDFSPFKLNQATDNRPLSTLSFWVLHQTGLVKHFGLNEKKLVHFLRCIEEGYPNNPYHNRIHACNVLHSVHILLIRGGLLPNLVDKLSALTAIVSAIIHDFQHGGLNNDYLVRSADMLAIRYNDHAPLENHHLAGSFMVLRHPECNFLHDLSSENMQNFRRLCIEMVLATDMKQHFNILSQFQSKLRIRAEDTGDAAAVQHCGHAGGPAAAQLDEHQLPMVLQVALKCADVGHLAAPRSVHWTWVQLLEEEFFRQGDRERMNGMAISPLMDRRKPGITRSQIGFFDIVALPMFRSFAQVFPEARPMLEAVEDNLAMWAELEKQHETVAGTLASGQRSRQQMMLSPEYSITTSCARPWEEGRAPRRGRGITAPCTLAPASLPLAQPVQGKVCAAKHAP